MLSYLHTFRRTMHDPSVYRDILSQPLRRSFAYFGLWYLLGSFIVAIIVNFTFLPQLFSDSVLILHAIEQQFPESLELTVSEGRLSTIGGPENVPPLIITNPIPSAAIANLLVINPTVPAETIVAQDTLVLVTQNAVAVRQSPSDTAHAIFDLDQLIPEQFKLTKSALAQFTQELTQTLTELYRFRWPLTPLVLTVSLLISRLLFLSIYTLPLLLLALLTQRPLSLVLIWKIGLHTLPLTDLINLFLRLIYQQPLNWLYLMTFVGLSTIALLSLHPKTSSI